MGNDANTNPLNIPKVSLLYSIQNIFYKLM